MTEQLKPCPFCGDKAKYYLAGNESLGYQPGVTCIKCLANVHGRFVEPGELGQEAEDVINRWNRRAEPERKAELREALREAEHFLTQIDPVHWPSKREAADD